VKKLCILGGGTAGWMTAAALSQLLKIPDFSVVLIESESIGTVGVGEATFPHIRHFNAKLGINETEFMARTKASFKLGIEFKNWGCRGDSYIHAFGRLGDDIGGIPFHHHWASLYAKGLADPIETYSLPAQAARKNRFAHPDTGQDSQSPGYSYAFQFDAGLYAAFLREFAERNGVVRYEGAVNEIEQDGESGFIKTLTLDNGKKIAADIFVDCSGFRGLLIEETLKSGYEDWSHWLPCNRAVAAPCAIDGPLTPYTRATAQEAGWMWRIPLQHRVGNGHVYCSNFISDDDAAVALVAQMEASPLAEPKFLQFTTGRRRKQWSKNVVAIGLAAGFLEPLESTSIHLIQLAIGRLLDFFPGDSWDSMLAAEYNRLMDLEYQRVRDFLILHYHVTRRDDTPFWNYVRTMSVPDSVTEKMESFRERGIVANYPDGMFHDASWVAVLTGQGIVPEHIDPRAANISEAQTIANLAQIATACESAAHRLPQHEDYIKQIGANAH
jgi:tryptophan 7-halogenase